MIVLDASAVIEWLLRLPGAGAVEERVARAASLQDLADLPMERYPHDLFLPRIWSLRDHVTAYDGCYRALAEALQAPLLTCDARLASVPGHDAVVEVVAPAGPASPPTVPTRSPSPRTAFRCAGGFPSSSYRD